MKEIKGIHGKLCRQALARKHSGLVDDIEGVELSDRARLQQLRGDVQIADAVYERSVTRPVASTSCFTISTLLPVWCPFRAALL